MKKQKYGFFAASPQKSNPRSVKFNSECHRQNGEATVINHLKNMSRHRHTTGIRRKGMDSCRQKSDFAGKYAHAPANMHMPANRSHNHSAVSALFDITIIITDSMRQRLRGFGCMDAIHASRSPKEREGTTIGIVASWIDFLSQGVT